MSETIIMIAGGTVVVGILLKEVASVVIKRSLSASFCSAHESIVASVSSLKTDVEVIKNNVEWIRCFMEKKDTDE